MSSHSTRMAYLGTQPRTLAAPAGMWTRLRAVWMARQTRRLLSTMDDRMLADIGVGRGDAMVEAARPLWDIGSR